MAEISNKSMQIIEVPRLRRDHTDPLYQVPKIAWPTLLMLACGLALWVGTLYLLLYHDLAVIYGVILLTVASYMLFTPMHEAVHHSVFKNRPYANWIVGNIAAIFMGPTSSYRAYAYLHLEHHRHTNDPQNDPDYWSGKGPVWWLPISWLTTDFYYYYFYMKRASTRPWTEKIEIYIFSVLYLGIFAWFCWIGYTREVLLYWFLPGRLAATLLAAGFNFFPHRPYTHKAADEPYQATAILSGMKYLLTPLLMAHNYHLIHHLFPGIPFYRYAQIYQKRYGELKVLGARIVKFL